MLYRLRYAAREGLELNDAPLPRAHPARRFLWCGFLKDDDRAEQLTL